MHITGVSREKQQNGMPPEKWLWNTGEIQENGRVGRYVGWLVVILKNFFFLL